MPPAFNLSQDQTLQFKPVTVFGPSLNRSLTQRTDDDPSAFRRINLPLILCEASDTFALQQIPQNPPPHSASSAHTYRLLVFKDRSAHHTAPNYPAPLRLRRCVCSREMRLWRVIDNTSSPFCKFFWTQRAKICLHICEKTSSPLAQEATRPYVCQVTHMHTDHAVMHARDNNNSHDDLMCAHEREPPSSDIMRAAQNFACPSARFERAHLFCSPEHSPTTALSHIR
jgi:hypothetical protein